MSLQENTLLVRKYHFKKYNQGSIIIENRLANTEKLCYM